MALIISLGFLLMTAMLGVSSLQNATLQEKMAASLNVRTETFQLAEDLLRAGEAQVQAAGSDWLACGTVHNCKPPPDAFTLTSAGPSEGGVMWMALHGGFYAVQKLVHPPTPGSPDEPGAAHYRITAVVIRGSVRTVLESMHSGDRRILWRQRQ